MNRAKALRLVSILVMAVILLSDVGASAQPAGTPATSPAGSAASKSAATQPAYPLWDGKESVADYAKRAGIKDAQITLALDGNVTLKLNLIPAGKFLMGSPESENDRRADEGPQHEVTITKPFYMGVYTVTQAQWKAIMGTTIAQQRDKVTVVNKALYGEGDEYPMYFVPWGEAGEFCKKLSQKTGKTVRLPTEAQWEYACRAGSKTRFSFGDDGNKLRDYAWYTWKSDSKTQPVGQKKPNDFRLYDMLGNVDQWCSDWYADSYANAEKTDPTGPASGSNRVLRGGGWTMGGPRHCRSASRLKLPPGYRGIDHGFRVALDLK
jgi:formylglycine-generating enzyme required for sulfatase activity